MRILIICDIKDKYHLETVLIRNNVADQLNLIHKPNFEKAYEFLINQLFNNQGHIDLIITADKITNNLFDIHLVDRIRYMDEEYSKNNFKINQIPVILYEKEILSSDNYSYNFNARVAKNESDNQKHFIGTLNSVVRTARSAIMDDLDLLHLKVEDLQSDFAGRFNEYYLMRIQSDPQHWAGRTKILSESFIKNPGVLDYDWIKNNRIDWERDIDIYCRIMKYLRRYDRVHSEKSVLHHLYNRALWMMRLDIYNNPIYEPALMKTGSEYEEPDYLLPSPMPGIIPTNITEVKPHLFPMLHKRLRKPGFKQKYNDALIQISDYERYARNKKGKQQLEELVLYPIEKMSFTLLSSNDGEKDNNYERIEELRRDHFPKIKIETHNERLEDVIKYFERIQPLNVLNY